MSPQVYVRVGGRRKTYHADRDCPRLSPADDESVAAKDRSVLAGHFDPCGWCVDA